jgi:hypothetical protein
MKLFSHRKGLRPVRTKLQIDSIDQGLKNRLWSSLDGFYWHGIRIIPIGFHQPAMKDYRVFFERLWDEYFKEPLDTLPSDSVEACDVVRKWFFDSSRPWYDVYDFIELVVEYHPQKDRNKKFMDACNSVLESELSAYRFVGGRITQITTEEEISEIEEALDIPLKPVHDHLEKSLELFSDKKSPDYPNSVKESISAVESMCNKITGMKKSTLGKCLDRIDSVVPIHGALREAFDHLYGYASSEEGIRHGSIKQSDVDFEIAKFMLVSCSAFVNYLILKASKAGIKI